MLLEFRVRNFRTFRDETAFSMVASPDKSLAEHNTTATGLSQPSRAVLSAAIYGANASGKTNFLRALESMRHLVVGSASLPPDQPLPFEPFRLDAASILEPTLFEISIVIRSVRYQYGFEFTAGRIVAEWLLVYETTRPQRWIDRVGDPAHGQDTFAFSDYLSGPKKLWQEATRPNALFLSTAVRLNSEKLRPLYEWFSATLYVSADGAEIDPTITAGMLHDDPSRSREVKRLLNAADLAISDIAVEKRSRVPHRLRSLISIAAGKDSSVEFLFPTFEHSAGGVSAKFELEDESLGTQRLFALAGPILDIIAKGRILVIDEIDRNLHPLLVRGIIATFQDNEVNRLGAQLIFSTHDTSLLDSALLRRDQIWFAEKDRTQSAALIPLSDFSPRKTEALEKGYLSGRYGAIPILDPLLRSPVADVKT